MYVLCNKLLDLQEAEPTTTEEIKNTTTAANTTVSNMARNLPPNKYLKTPECMREKIRIERRILLHKMLKEDHRHKEFCDQYKNLTKVCENESLRHEILYGYEMPYYGCGPPRKSAIGLRAAWTTIVMPLVLLLKLFF
ncbi:hypothetical protein O0L34_g10179 [Tuta absoluta]|nr:hypothetical protein O0L34_g10179 [Tuta absoluta]